MKPFLAAVLAGLALMTARAHVLAEPKAHATQPLELRNIMKELGRNVQTITDGISREDWLLVEKTASLIADHPQPPLAEKMRIMHFAGTSIGKFKSYDGATHDAAKAVAKAAGASDGEGVILAFQKLQTACYNCHQAYREPLVKHFYETH
jgi:cytochrome c556